MRPVPITVRLQGCRWHDESAGILPHLRADPPGGEALERDALDSLRESRAIGHCAIVTLIRNPKYQASGVAQFVAADAPRRGIKPIPGSRRYQHIGDQ